jgi:hypothetical protein
VRKERSDGAVKKYSVIIRILQYFKKILNIEFYSVLAEDFYRIYINP